MSEQDYREQLKITYYAEEFLCSLLANSALKTQIITADDYDAVVRLAFSIAHKFYEYTYKEEK